MKFTLYLVSILWTLCACSGTKKVVEQSDEKIINQTDSLAVPISNSVETITQQNPIAVVETPNKITEVDVSLSNGLDHSDLNRLLQKHVSEEGLVDYKKFKTDQKHLAHYISNLGKNLPQETWTKPEQLAYWINAYNALTIDLILRHYPIKSIKDIKDPWKQRFWKLGDKWYNLDEIEHSILRNMNEPRIHFAIVCASYSCPKLLNEAFTSIKLEEQLTKATKGFLNNPERNSISKNELELSKIFQWFIKDFKTTGTLIDFLNQYSDIEISEQSKIKYKDYNWALNE